MATDSNQLSAVSAATQGHTPGPWTDAHGSGTLYARIPDEQRLPKRVGRAQQVRMSIATIHNAAEPHMRPGESAANLRLIAAAPQLAEACELAFRHIDQNDPMREHVAKRLRAALSAAGIGGAK
jgi:hypothetical protein